MKILDRKIMLFDTKNHLKILKSRIKKNGFDQKLLKQQIENTESLINAIENNQPLVG